MAKQVQRFVGPTRLTNAAATIYTSPGLSRSVITHIHFMNPGAALTVTVTIGADGATTRVLEAVTVGAGATYDWYSPGIVLDVSEIMQAYASVTNQVNMTMFGYTLTAG